GNNALLESPTGTGKTLCLLCSRARLAAHLRGVSAGRWGRGRQPSSPYPVIIYASRTHSQLRQVIKELKATSYRAEMAVLGSREQMCIHEEVSKLGKAQNNGCHYLCKKRGCRHNNIVTEYMKNNTELGTEPFDIEDLLSKSVDILFAPYNYLIDPGNRHASFDLLTTTSLLVSRAQECIQLCSFKGPLKILLKNNLTQKTILSSRLLKFHVNESRQTSGDSLQVYGKASRTLSWWCFNPGLACGGISENPHVISQDQIWVGVVLWGHQDTHLILLIGQRETVKYKQELGTVMVNFAQFVPDGLLVFFPSYSMMDKCIDYWKNRNHEHSVDDSTIWQRMCKHKQPVIEPRQSSNFPNAIEDYAAKLRDPSTSRAIFFAVCRGKVSEGLDFADRAGRAVIVTGMPFSTPTDPKVRLKREYLDKQAKPSNKIPKALTGEEWYVQQAARAVNQAVGRVIRHRHDYGAIIYCDERFVWPNYQSQMSYWLKPYIKCYSKYGEVVQTLTRFFRDKVCVDPKEMDCNDSVTPPADKCLPQKIVSDSPATAVNGHRGTTVSLNATTRKNNYMKFTQITPANRTTLPMKHGCSTSSQHVSSRGQISQDSQVVDLIDNAAMHGQLKEHALKSMRLKKAKIADVSSQLKHNVESRALTGNQGQQSTPPSKRSTIEQACEKNEAIQERCGGPESTTGPAFLKLAREKLSTAEYGEFVEFMKALKLKTMHIKDSLEAIAKLFSSPGRLTLLEGFRVFVSKNHLPLYEQLVKKYTMANT
ncbi:hypothetical protein ZWY2020_010719, partial [Hordeum vulgare]